MRNKCDVIQGLSLVDLSSRVNAGQVLEMKRLKFKGGKFLKLISTFSNIL